LRKNLSRGGIDALKEQLAEQDAKVRAAQTNVDRLREFYNIADAMATADAPTMLMSAEQYRKLESMRIELEAQLMREEETLLDSLKVMSRDKLVYTLPTAAPDAALTSLVETRSLTRQALIVKQKDYGVEHPEVVKLRSALEELNGQIDNQVDGILLGLDTRVSAVREQLNKLKIEVEKAKNERYCHREADAAVLGSQTRSGQFAAVQCGAGFENYRRKNRSFVAKNNNGRDYG